MTVRAEDLIGIAERVLRNSGVLDYRDLQVTYAVKSEGKWKVSFEFDCSHSRSAIKRIGSFAVDAKSEELEGMWLDRSWR